MDSMRDGLRYSGVVERRSLRRLQVDVHLDDLQAELEAGARALEKIHTQVSRGEQFVAAHARQAGSMRDLLHRIEALRGSVQQQRATLAELRQQMRALRELRRQLARPSPRK